MNIKKIAYDKIIGHLKIEISKVDSEIRWNKYEIEKVVNKQTALKRQRTELMKLISIVQGDIPEEKKQ